MAYPFSHLQESKTKIIDWLQGEYRSIQTGRATPQVLDLVHIDMYGTRTALPHAASITVEDPRTLRVSPWDKTILNDFEKAINDANLGLSVSTDEHGLRVHFPALTTETREKMVKLLKERLEESRIKVRALREEINKDIDARGKGGEYGEDDRLRYREELQKSIEEINAELGSLFDKKEREVMGK
jgi:ribosome recycling factor